MVLRTLFLKLMGSAESKELIPTDPLFNEIDILMGKFIKIEFF